MYFPSQTPENNHKLTLKLQFTTYLTKLKTFIDIFSTLF